jgi:uncharacterized protein YjbI with pentapeptide repeats
MQRDRIDGMASAHADWLRKGGSGEGRWSSPGGMFTNASFRRRILKSADFSDAELVGCDLSEADLSEARFVGARFKNINLASCNFRGSDLSYSRFEGSIGLTGEMFALANLKGAVFTQDISWKETLHGVSDLSRSIGRTFLSIVLSCVYSFLTIAATNDAELLVNSISSPLPILNTQIAIAHFYVVAPVIIFSLYLHLHLSLLRLLDKISRLPLVFPDGSTVDDFANLWLTRDLIKIYSEHISPYKMRIFRLQYTFSQALTVFLVPFTILALLARYLPRHSLPGAAFILLAFFASIYLAYLFKRMISKYFQPRVDGGKSPFVPHPRLAGAMAALFAGICLFMEGMFGGRFPHWEGKLPFFYADLRKCSLPNRDFSQKSLYGAVFYEADVRYADFRGAFLKKANFAKARADSADFNLADLQGASFVDANVRGTNFCYAVNIDMFQFPETTVKDGNNRFPLSPLCK